MMYGETFLRPEHQLQKSQNESQKGMPLETKNTKNYENWKLGFFEPLHMQHCKCIKSIMCFSVETTYTLKFLNPINFE